ncbi:N-terminal ig-like domain of cellulase [Thermoflavifilum thermophilum]|uniref:N-terminal ig-like domain of cellulase n=2 Tax=Thermoflavifilum thermophilum TaxID=1393122 RepID=A0A1I7N0V2_9BACT|nr:N-terminal ig-like domain of cellulase [Thermoflavifilum thermophilum]
MPEIIACFMGYILSLGLHVQSNNHSSRMKIVNPVPDEVIRYNQLGYLIHSPKVAIWASYVKPVPDSFSLCRADDGQCVWKSACSRDFGVYGPFSHTARLDFTDFHIPGTYVLKAGNATTAAFSIGDEVYRGIADFCLQYLRAQQCGLNPVLRDSCHTHDGYTLYGPMPDYTHVDVVGGWHDASDYLRYVTTSATTTYYLLAAYRNFPEVFTDSCQANGLPGKNGIADVLDEARWGLNWLLKMHPRPDWMFHQVADDRDHAGFRLPNQDSVSYGFGLERPVYFCTGAPQGLSRYQNHSTGVASVAGKMAACFALGAILWKDKDSVFANLLRQKAFSAYHFGEEKPGYCQTAPNLAPYYYTEQDWQDDMELGAALLWQMSRQPKFLRDALRDADADPLKPWMGADTALHYQWYPFFNAAHAELIVHLKQDKLRKKLLGYYRKGIEAVWQKAKQNAFYRGIPFIWCSNNLTAAFAMQCWLYRHLSGDHTYQPLEQACIDWLLGCNPWGSSFIIGLPGSGICPHDPHAAFSHLAHIPIHGGLVDGPVYGSIFHGLIGVHLSKPDSFAAFQSDLAVYHDDWVDYATNEPTLDGTATALYLFAAMEAEGRGINK